MSKKVWALAALFILIGSIALVACQPTAQTVEVTRVVTETVVEEGAPVEVTRVVQEVVEVTAVPTEAPAQPKDLVVCMAQEPPSLYFFSEAMLTKTAVLHAIYENTITQVGFDYQAPGLEKLPSLADGDAVLNTVTVNEGDTVRKADDTVGPLAVGDMITNAAGETVEFDGNPVEMEQLVVDFTLKPRVWSDGTPVTAADSVYGFNLAADPDTTSAKYTIERTVSYEATGDLSTRWTGVPGFKDATYFTNFWQPFPEHVWGEYTAAELAEADLSNRAPMGDGAFVVEEWIPGDSIRLVKNTNYWRASEGLPYLDSVTYKFIPDTNQLLAQLLAGQCDIGTQDGMGSDQTPFLEEAQATGILVPYFEPSTVYEHIDFNINPYGDYADSRYDWFEDPRVRQAMTMCTDRQGMVDSIFYGQTETVSGYIPSFHPLYPTEGVTEWTFDPEAGNALLDEAGYDQRDADGFRLDPSGARFAPTLGTTAGNAMRQQLTQIFKENMAACGIDVQLYFQPAGEWFADGPDGVLFGRRYDLGEFAWVLGTEPSCDLYMGSRVPGPAGEIFEATGQPYVGWGGDNQNNTGWANAEYDAFCVAALGSLRGTPEYTDNHQSAFKIFSQEVPVIPLFTRLKVAATRPEVRNFIVDVTEASEMFNIAEFDLVQE